MKSANKKGSGFELKIAKDLRDSGIFRGCCRSRGQRDSMGIDLDNTGSWAMQLKFRKNFVPINTIKEVQCEEDEKPCLVTKANRDETYVVIKWEDFKHLLNAEKFVNKHRKELGL